LPAIRGNDSVVYLVSMVTACHSEIQTAGPARKAKRKVRSRGGPTITVDTRYVMPFAVPMVRESR
jgi:hypothetical protein